MNIEGNDPSYDPNYIDFTGSDEQHSVYPPTEIEGEATLIPDADFSSASPEINAEYEQPPLTPDYDGQTFSDSIDDAILIKLDGREKQVAPGGSVKFVVTLLNNGLKSAMFRLRVEGWIRSEWVSVAPTHMWLNLGEEHRFEITIAPPTLSSHNPTSLPNSTLHNSTQADLEAGRRPFLITVLSPEYPQRQSQLTAEIELLSIVRYRVGAPRPRHLISSWHNQSATTVVPVTNYGNVPTHFAVEGASKGRRRETSCRFEFLTFGSTAQSFGQTQITLEPGQTTQVHVRITPVDRVLIGFGAKTLPFCVAAWPIPEKQVTSAHLYPPGSDAQATYGKVKRVPLIGASVAAAAATMALFAMVAAGLLGLTTLMALLPSARSPQVALPAVVMPAAEQPPLEIVVKVAEPVPSPQTLAVVKSPERAKLTVADAMIAQMIAESAGSEEDSEGNFEDDLEEDSTADSVVEAIDESSRAAEQESDLAVIDAEISADEEEIADSSPNVPELKPIQYVDGVPVIQPAMISSPGSGEGSARVAASSAQNISPQGGAIGAAERAALPVPIAAAGNGVLTYDQMFKEVAQSFDLDWRILAAQAYVESGFDPLAVGSKGDLGLMQILPSTWAEWAPRTGAVDPYNGYHNVSVSAVYSSNLRDMFAAQGYTDPKWRLVAYNWGPNRLRIFLNEGRKWDDLPELRKKYARDILRIAASLPLE